MVAGRTEFELKFTGPPGDVAKLPQSRLFAALAPEGGSWERLTSTYFDTAEGALAAVGLSLRLREEGANVVQAVKARGATPAARREFETDLGDVDNFPASAGDRDIDAAIKGEAGQLIPIARTQVDRWSALIDYRGARIELAVDLGSAESRDGEGRKWSGPLAEVELELISGDRTAVFDFARLLLDNANLRLAGGAKLDAALGLQRQGGVIAKAKPVTISADSDAGAVLAASLAGTAMRLASLAPEIVDMRRPEGVHQMRVALRRFRANERIFRRHVRSSEIADLAARAKSIGAALGPARDWDVFIDETLHVTGDDNAAPTGLKVLKAAAEEKRAQAWVAVVEAVSSAAYTHFTLDLLEAATLQHWREDAHKACRKPSADYAPTALDRALKKAVKTAGMARAPGDLAALHPLRIALKKLRYPLQLYRSLYPKEARRDYMRALSGLQESLGVINDAVTAQGLADEAAEGRGQEAMRAAGFISGYKAAEAQNAAREIDAAWDAFEKMTPFWRSP